MQEFDKETYCRHAYSGAGANKNDGKTMDKALHSQETNMKCLAKFFSVLSLVAIIAACGGGIQGLDLSGISIDPILPPANPGGIWSGTLTSAGVTNAVDGVITENGEGRFVDENGTRYVVTGIGGSGNIRGVTFDIYAQDGYQFLDGSTIGTGDFTGTVVERSTFSGSFSFSTGESGSITMDYDPIYDRDSSLAKLSGSWDEGPGVLVVDPDGSFFEQDQFGCIYDGQVSLIDAVFNAYRLTMTVSDCDLANGDYTGIGVLVDLNVAGDEDLFVVQMNSLESIFAATLERL